MTISDLKTGMTVVRRDGSKAKVLLNIAGHHNVLLLQAGNWNSLGDYNVDLTYIGSDNEDLDIMEIHNYPIHNLLSFATSFHIPLWKRNTEPVIELTIKINGKEVSPTEISAETWNNLRK